MKEEQLPELFTTIKSDSARENSIEFLLTRFMLFLKKTELGEEDKAAIHSFVSANFAPKNNQCPHCGNDSFTVRAGGVSVCQRCWKDWSPDILLNANSSARILLEEIAALISTGAIKESCILQLSHIDFDYNGYHYEVFKNSRKDLSRLSELEQILLPDKNNDPALVEEFKTVMRRINYRHGMQPKLPKELIEDCLTSDRSEFAKALIEEAKKRGFASGVEYTYAGNRYVVTGELL